MKIITFGAATLMVLISSFDASAAEIISVDKLLEQERGQILQNQWYGIALLSAIILTCIIVLFALWRVKRRLNAIQNSDGEVRATWWDLFRKGGHTKDILMEGHDIDGIMEYDNNPPAWFNWILYGTTVWAVGYMLYFHVFNWGDSQEQAYDKQMKEYEVIVAKAQEKAIELANAPMYTDAEKLASGKTVFQTNCATCHGQNGQGDAGPNLTDEFWINGGGYPDIFKTIFNGVPEKAMPTWKKMLKPDDIRAVASYVYSLKGTNPPNGKAPQGEKYTSMAE